MQREVQERNQDARVTMESGQAVPILYHLILKEKVRTRKSDASSLKLYILDIWPTFSAISFYLTCAQPSSSGWSP